MAIEFHEDFQKWLQNNMWREDGVDDNIRLMMGNVWSYMDKYIEESEKPHWQWEISPDTAKFYYNFYYFMACSFGNVRPDYVEEICDSLEEMAREDIIPDEFATHISLIGHHYIRAFFNRDFYENMPILDDCNDVNGYNMTAMCKQLNHILEMTNKKIADGAARVSA